MGVACKGRGVLGFWFGKPEENRQCGTARRRLEDNNKMNIKLCERAWIELICLRIAIR